jgi:type I restriction enzyme S subunit
MVAKAGSVDPKKFADEKFELFSIPAFDRGFSELALGSEIGSSKQIVRPGDLMLSKIVPHIRRAWIVPASSSHRQIASGEWILFRDPRIHGPYLRQLLTSDFFNRQFMQTVAGVGGSLLRARPAHVGKIKVPLPPLVEQRRVAAILDKADELRTQRRQALVHLDILTQSMFHDLLSQNSGSERRRLEDVVTAVIDCPHTTPQWTETGVTCLRTSNLGFGGWDWNDHRFVSEGEHHKRSKRAYLEPEDIILSREGTVGVAAIVPEGMVASLGQRLVQVRPNPKIVVPLMLLHYLLFTLSPVRISNLMVGATSKHLNVKDLRNLAVPVPPLAAQHEFAVRISAIERLKNQHRIQLSEIDALFASLQSRAFKGEL